MARERPDQRSRLALRAEVRVDRPDRALAGVVRAGLHQHRGELGRDPRRRRLVDTPDRLEDVEDVDVGDVVQLVAAALAEGDHREARRRGIGDLGPRDRQRRLEGARGQVGQLRRGVVDADVMGEVARRESGEQPPVLDPERVHGVGVPDGRGRAVARGIGSDGPQQRRRASAYAAGRVDPRNGSASSRHCSGCRQRWSVSAWLAPSTESSRIAVPSSFASSSTSPGSARSASRTSPDRAWSGSAEAASSGTSGSASSPSRASSPAAVAESSNPIRSSRVRTESPRELTRVNVGHRAHSHRRHRRGSCVRPET